MNCGLARQSMFTANVRLTKGGKEWYSFLNRVITIEGRYERKMQIIMVEN